MASDNQGDTWTYNSNGYLTNYNGSPLKGIETAYTYDSLNQLLTQTQIQTAGTTITTTDTYTYPGNPLSFPVTNWQTGKSTGALWSTDVQVVNGVTTTFTYTYVLNSQNKLEQETITSSAAGSTPVVTYYTYY